MKEMKNKKKSLQSTVALFATFTDHRYRSQIFSHLK